MIRMATHDRTTLVLREVIKPHATAVGPNWYSSIERKFTNVRYVRIRRQYEPWTYLATLTSNPDLNIYTIVDHAPILSAYDLERINRREVRKADIARIQRILDPDGDEYIDEFGRHVYITSRIGLKQKDIDLRYEPEMPPDPELFDLQYIEYDLPYRKS